MDHKKNGILHEIEENSNSFSLAFISIFTVSFIFLAIVGATPDPMEKWNKEHGGTEIPAANITAAATSTGATAANPSTSAMEEATRIVIDAIGLDVSVSNPTSTDVDILDAALLKGAVRYPTSALLGGQGTILLFGHSSYLPVVHNQAYKAFDGIQNLKTGQEISVYSATKEYRYRVVGVRTANADDSDTATINLPTEGQHLTLITCDSFGTKSDRFVVTADFVGTYSLAR